MSLFRAAVIGAATCAACAAAGAHAQYVQPRAIPGAPSATPGSTKPPAPIPTSPGRADPSRVPDPHPTGKTSDEGSTAGSAAGAMSERDASNGRSQSNGQPAAPPSSDSAYAGAKSSDPNDKSNRRVPATRERPPQ